MAQDQHQSVADFELLETYLLYGCQVEANNPLPGLSPVNAGRADTAVMFGTPPLSDSGSGRLVYSGDFVVVRRVDAGYHFAYGDGTEFLVSPEGSRVVAATPPGLDLEDTCCYLVGPVIGFVLRLRGVVCLHASTVVIGGRAIAFCGPSGAGKSTTAAAFAQRGHAIVAEDVAALDDRGSAFFVQPGYPRINLWPQSAAALCGSEDALPQITPTWGKGYLALTGLAQFHPAPAPLAAVYMIGSRSPGASPEIRELTAVDAFMALAANTYTPYLLDAAMRAREFDVLRRLVAHVPIRLVHPPEDIANIGSLCDALLQDYGALAVTEAAA
jgi:hypothetical protein